MENLLSGDLSIEAVQTGPHAPIQLFWRGKSNDRHPAKVLGPYFGRVMDAAAQRGTGVEMHFEKLAHFNSSTIAAIIQLIQDTRDRGIRLVIVFDNKLMWQKLSFDALKVFASGGDDLLTLRSAEAAV